MRATIGICFLFIMILLISMSNLAQALPSRVQSVITIQNLTIEDAIALALDRSLDLSQAKFGLDNARISYDNAWDTMYMPGISLSMSSTSSTSVNRIPGTPADKSPAAGFNRGYPNSAVALTLGNYTLFNFNRDQLAYNTAKLTYDRAKQVYNETQRSIKFRLINTYFSAKTEQEKLDVAKRSVDISRAIHDLIKSRFAIGTSTPEEVSSSASDLINAQTAYVAQQQLAFESMATLNIILNTSIQQPFILVSNIKYTPLKISPDEAFQTFRGSSPAIRNSTLSLKSAENSLEIAQKNRLPLPIISFSGVTLSYGRGYGGGNTAWSNGGSGNSGQAGGQIDLQAVVSLTLPILGPGGFLGSRTIASSQIARDSAELAVVQTSTIGDFEIQRQIAAIKRQELQLPPLKEVLDNNMKLLASVFKRMTTVRVTRLELRDAITQARTSEIDYLQAVFFHLTSKLSFAELIGVDQLPGDNFI